jgi:Na+-translocating ferredoxin:NAD+ oxidoreductase RnfD subunit
MTLKRYFRTPKGLLIILLAILTTLAAWGEGFRLVAPGLLGAMIVAMLIDAPILRAREGEWLFPDGALLTGCIVALILSPHEPWIVAAVTSAVGIVSKYVFRVGRANVFNPSSRRSMYSTPARAGGARCRRFRRSRWRCSARRVCSSRVA